MAKNLSKPLLLSAILLPLVGCAGTVPTIANRLEARPAINQLTSLVEPLPEARYDLRKAELGENYWSDLVRYSAPGADNPYAGFYCGLYEIPSPKPGAWQFVGASKSLTYVPILDLYAERRGLRSKNDLVYYHFELRQGGR